MNQAAVVADDCGDAFFYFFVSHHGNIQFVYTPLSYMMKLLSHTQFA